MYFGIPVVGYRTKDGKYLENTQLEPDLKVRNDYDQVIDGRDQQLEVAVKELLRQIDARRRQGKNPNPGLINTYKYNTTEKLTANR